MPDDPNETAQDRKRIALEQEHELRYWTKSLDCTPDELRAAVKAVGNSAEKVKEYLNSRK